MKKSIIIFLSVLAMSLTFSGCGESEGSVSVGSANPSSNTVNTVDTAAPTSNVGNDNVIAGDEDAVFIASKSSIEEIFGEVPANPGNKQN